MHISLDSAIGQQRRLNQIGETINSIAAPAAAYSLRSLTGGDPKVVRVRRSSDNSEQDFNASGVHSGALVNFVGSGNDGFVETWYDQAGSSNATQTDTAKQPKIVDGGSLVTGGIDFLNGTNTHLDTTNSDLCNVAQLSVFTVLTPHLASSQLQAFSCGSTVVSSTGYGGWVLNLNGYSDVANLQTQAKGNGSITSLSLDVTSSECLLGYVFTFPNGSGAKNSGTAVTKDNMITPNQTGSGARKFRIGCQFTFTTAGFYTKPIKEIIIYTTDQTSNKGAIETNILNAYPTIS